jgi:hypothetical protein
VPNYFDKFPKVPYSLSQVNNQSTQLVTNILVRVGFVQEILNNIFSYYEYTITEGQTPEMVAEMTYGDPEAHWMILLSNNRMDAQFDWPLETRPFTDYLIGKYGSIAIAQTTYHHYERIVTRTDSRSGLISQEIYLINPSDVGADLDDNIPYDTYNAMAETDFETYNLIDGTAVEQVTTKNRVTFYDWEDYNNELKRQIRLIKPIYYPSIKGELASLMTKFGVTQSAGFRDIRNF